MTSEAGAGATATTPRDLRSRRPSGPPGPAVVTGSESGIGRAVAVELARRGHDVGVTWFQSQDEGEASAEEVRGLGRRAEVAHLDLREPVAAGEAVAGLVQALGGVEVLVNVAGTGTSSLLLDTSYEDWREVLSTDLDGAFCCLQQAGRAMVAAGRGGRIVNVTSVHEHQPRVGSGAYCAAKGGLGMLTRTAAFELAEHGITVNAVAPGEISTPMTGQTDVDPHTETRPGVPLGRPGDAREIAAVVGFLCSPEASYVTGQSWAVDGGMLQMGPMAGSHLTSDDWRRP